MGKYDKDRFQKELALRYCLARGMVPFMEVVVSNVSDLSDSVELLTDVDVLGIEAAGDEFRRIIFDCKTSNRMSSINRAFWAAGVMKYCGANHAHVILKSKAVDNHRISALSIGVDLHTEGSFSDLGRTLDSAFPADNCYQSSVTRWNDLFDCYQRNAWSAPLFSIGHHSVPLSKSPWAVFRRLIAELRSLRGSFDPANSDHVAIFLDCLASQLVLWAMLGRDVRRFYEPTMSRSEFEKTLRYYMWGGRESYQIRQQMREKAAQDSTIVAAVELPAWDQLVGYVGLIIGAPQSILECASVCRDLALRQVSGVDPKLQPRLAATIGGNTRIKQFSLALSDYLIAACGLPKDMARQIQAVILAA